MRRWLLLAALLVAWVLPAAAEAPRVVVSIKPLHSLAAALLEGISQPVLLLDGAASPHAHAMRPSERRALQQADVVVWVGPELEAFLEKPLSVLPDQVRVVGLLRDVPDLHRLRLAEHGHEGHGHARAGEELDPHIWLSPGNARLIARHLTEIFATFGETERLAANAAALDQRLVVLQADMAERLAPMQARPFVVFHPAYNYLVEAFGLRQAGTLALSPDHSASARHVADLRQEITRSGAVCAFAEPQFADRSLAGLARGTGLRVAVLDPLGVDVPAGPGAYVGTLRQLADALATCLAG
jgi:zinc transport system substrate-binding protein